MVQLAKLDSYDYIILPGVVQIRLENTRDPSMVDILSEIERSNGKIYVEGHYFLMAGYNIIAPNGPDASTYLNLIVTQAE